MKIFRLFYVAALALSADSLLAQQAILAANASSSNSLLALSESGRSDATANFSLTIPSDGHSSSSEGAPLSAKGPVLATTGAASAGASEPTPLFSRWVAVTEMSESQRYRNSFDENGKNIFDSGQQRTVLAGRIKLDAADRYFIGIRASSGQFFNWAYADYIGHDFLYYAGLTLAGFTKAEVASFYAALAADPAGANHNFADKGWNFYVRDLYISATPIKQVTVEFGSIQIERGYSSEITTFDDDGFIAGERIRIHDAKHLGADEISFTSAYLGDVVTPNFFRRGNRLKQSNYRQVAAKKMINKHVGVSAEYNWLNSTNTLREAAFFKVPESKVFDEVHLELYQRVNAIVFPGVANSFVGPVAPEPISGGAGFAIFAAKKVGPVSGDFGYARVDSHYGVYLNSRFLEDVGFSLNGDSYSTGNRIFSHMTIKLNPVVSLFGYYTHTVSGDSYTYCKQGYNAGLKFDLKALVNAEKKII